MSGQFLYFMPVHKPCLTKADLPKALQDVWYDVTAIGSRACSKGPDGRAGNIVSLAADIAYKPENQKWTRAQGGDYWLGWNDGGLPGERDLRRCKTIDGDPVVLGDGAAWTVPILHGPGLTLPRAFGWGPNGSVQLRIIPRYEELVAHSERYLEMLQGVGEFPAFDDWFHYCVKLLSVNYRVGVDECLSLEPLVQVSRQFIIEICRASLGIAAFEQDREMQKKMAATADAGSADCPAAAG